MDTRHDFTSRVVAITGGASGMGAATARLFKERGGTVIIIDRDGDLAGDAAALFGLPPPLVGDVSDAAFCAQAVAEITKDHGQIDVLVNAAGVIVRADGIDTSPEQWHRVMSANVDGTFFMCQAALRSMRIRRSGAIVNFGSIWGDLGTVGAAAYCASKGAVHNLTRALALEHANDNIRINAVCPGEVDTPMLRSGRAGSVTDEILVSLAASVPMGRLAQATEVAEVVAFLASDNASYMTGSLVTVDAGYSSR